MSPPFSQTWKMGWWGLSTMRAYGQLVRVQDCVSLQRRVQLRRMRAPLVLGVS